MPACRRPMERPGSEVRAVMLWSSRSPSLLGEDPGETRLLQNPPGDFVIGTIEMVATGQRDHGGEAAWKPTAGRVALVGPVDAQHSQVVESIDFRNGGSVGSVGR